MKKPEPEFLLRLLGRCEHLAIKDGRLEIVPTNRKLIEKEWLERNRERIIRLILQITCVDGLTYTGKSTGNYSVSHSFKRTGVKLMFTSLTTAEEHHAFYNVDLTRQKNSKNGKKGARLPDGEFRITKNYALYKFWKGTGLAFPKRLASLHDYMGNLRELTYSFTPHADNPGRIDTAAGIHPLNVSFEKIVAATERFSSPDTIQTSSGHGPNMARTSEPDIDLSQSHTTQASQPDPSACNSKYELSHQDNKITRSSSTPYKSIEDQSNEAWLADYEKPRSDCEHPTTLSHKPTRH